MSTIALSVMLVLFVVFLFIGFAYINKKQKNKVAAIFLSQLSKSGAENNLSFSSQELLNGSIIGLDATRLKLLILQECDEDRYERNIIDLKLVKNCSVKKIYKPFYEEISREIKIENYLDKIVLYFEFTDNRGATEIIFYKHITNNIYEMNELEHKARKWKSMLLQMTANKMRQIA